MSEPILPRTRSAQFERMREHYLAGDLPWDAELPPPELIALVALLPPGRALDLGCGTGRACIYLARAGWQVDGVDFVPEAIALATARVQAAGVEEAVRLHCSSVTAMPFLAPPYDLALDVGCMHALDDDDLHAYRAELARLLRPGGVYLCFVRRRTPGDEEPTRGIDLEALRQVFTPAFAIEHEQHGTTTAADQTWESAWLWMRRVIEGRR